RDRAGVNLRWVAELVGRVDPLVPNTGRARALSRGVRTRKVEPARVDLRLLELHPLRERDVDPCRTGQVRVLIIEIRGAGPTERDRARVGSGGSVLRLVADLDDDPVPGLRLDRAVIDDEQVELVRLLRGRQ